MSMTIGALAACVGCTVDTIRYYERLGLLPRPARSVTGRRHYVEADCRRLAFVRRSRAVGFSLGEVRELLRLLERGDDGCVAARRLAADHVEALDRRIRELQGWRTMLAGLAAQCDRSDRAGCPILEAMLAPPSHVAEG